MAEKSTYIMLDRNILKWRWYQSPNTFRLFVHLLIKANIKDADFEDITVHRGQLVTSHSSLSRDLGISEKSVRTALGHLKRTGEVAVSVGPKYSVITVLNYDKYQSIGHPNGHPKGRLRAGEGQQSNNSNNKKEYIAASPVKTEVEFFDPYEELWK